jgi:sulfite reductase alpha subunit-like flavoprotein
MATQNLKNRFFSIVRRRKEFITMATLYILYGSATGNAEGISKDLAEKTPPSHFSSIVCKPMENFKKLSSEWLQPPTSGRKHGIILISSTTGNADAPENAGRFIRYMKRKQTAEAQPFQHCAFSVLGLGDTNYDQFCAIGKLVDKKMMELGGTRAKDLACADEATGLEDVVEPWLETVFSDIQKACIDAPNVAESKLTSPLQETNPSHQVNESPIGERVDNSGPVEDQRSDAADTQETVASSRSTAPSSPTPSKSGFPLFILYGSATGNSEQIAKDLATTYESLLLNPDAQAFFPSVVCCELDQFKRKCSAIWEQEPPSGTKHGVVIVASTSGNGDAPENAGRFVRYIKRKGTVDSQPFRHVQYAVLALGDTNYDKFCNAGKIIDKKLAELGGIHAKSLVCADEATGLADVVEPWTDSILAEITNACRAGGNGQHKRTNTASPIGDAMDVKTEQVEEEKKTETLEQVAETLDLSSMSSGVWTIRSLLCLEADTPMLTVEHSSLPSLGGSRSSCELFNDKDLAQTARRKSSFDDRATISTSSSAAIHYTINDPFVSTVVGSRYLTKTSSEGASKVCERLGTDGIKSDDDLLTAREILDAAFPLAGPDEQVTDRNGKRVIEMALSLPDDYTLEYQPGDALGLIVTNTPDAVNFILEMLRDRHGILCTNLVSIDSNHPIALQDIVREHVDLCCTIKNKRILHSLSQFATDPEEIAALRFLSSKSIKGEKLFQDFVVGQRRSVVDILRDFPSCQNISLEGLLSILSSIPPRYYSVSSSPLDKGREELSLTVAFSVVDYMTPSLIVNGKEVGLRRVHGIATSHLEALSAPFLCGSPVSPSSRPTVKIFPKPTAEFRLPSSLSTPIVLIGPGTGIAPFIGFVMQRRALLSSTESTDAANTVVEGTWRGDYELEAVDLPIGEKDASGLLVGADYRSQQQIGDVDVYFGCRHADHDFLYEDEMRALIDEGVITNLFSAFSRDSEKRQYVQDMMRAARRDWLR